LLVFASIASPVSLLVSSNITIKSHHLALGCISDDGQPRRLPEQTRSTTVEQADEQEEEDGVLHALEDLEAGSGSGGRREGAREQVGEDEQDVERDGLHGVEADEAGEGLLVAHDGEVEREEKEEGCERGGVEEARGGRERAEQSGEEGELREEEAAVARAVEERVEVGDGRHEAVGRLHRAAVVVVVRGARRGGDEEARARGRRRGVGEEERAAEEAGRRARRAVWGRWARGGG
jgi:hypothetical protein